MPDVCLLCQANRWRLGELTCDTHTVYLVFSPTVRVSKETFSKKTSSPLVFSLLHFIVECGILTLMSRIKPTTEKEVRRIAEALRAVAVDIEDARPQLAPIYEMLSQSLENSLFPKGRDFHFLVPRGQYPEKMDQHVWIRNG